MSHVVSLGIVALALSALYFTCHANDVTQDVIEKYWMNSTQLN